MTRTRWMSKTVVGTLLSLGLPAAGWADQAKVEQTLKGTYPGAQYQIREGPAVNGVKLYHADITTPQWQTTASLTENGDLLLAGFQETAETIPAAVRATVQSLFKNAEDFDAFFATSYYVYLEPAGGGGQYQIRLDAAGRLLEVVNQAQLSQQMQAATEPKALTGADAKPMADAVLKLDANAKIQSVKPWNNTPDLFIVSFTQGDENGYFIVDRTGRRQSERLGIAADQLPEPVRRTVSEVFKADRIVNVQRGQMRVVHVTQQIGGEPVTLKIHPNGSIMDIERAGAVPEDEKAVVAGHKEKKQRQPKGEGKGDGRREGDGKRREGRDGKKAS